MSTDCIFCKIIGGEIPSEMLYSDEEVTAFHDIHPVAPVHILIIPNKHIASVNEMKREDELLLGKLFSTARNVAQEQGISADGYRLIVNNGDHAGQVVHHLHMHLIGGQPMRYPMG